MDKWDKYDDMNIELIRIGNEFVFILSGRDAEGKVMPYPDERIERLVPKDRIERFKPDVGNVLSHPIYQVLAKMKRRAGEIMAYMIEEDMIHAKLVEDIEAEVAAGD